MELLEDLVRALRLEKRFLIKVSIGDPQLGIGRARVVGKAILQVAVFFDRHDIALVLREILRLLIEGFGSISAHLLAGALEKKRRQKKPRQSKKNSGST